MRLLNQQPAANHLLLSPTPDPFLWPVLYVDPCNYVAVNLAQIDIKEQHSFLLFLVFVEGQLNGIDVAPCRGR